MAEDSASPPEAPNAEPNPPIRRLPKTLVPCEVEANTPMTLPRRLAGTLVCNMALLLEEKHVLLAPASRRQSKEIAFITVPLSTRSETNDCRVGLISGFGHAMNKSEEQDVPELYVSPEGENAQQDGDYGQDALRSHQQPFFLPPVRKNTGDRG